jgi:hypothetical protein
MPSPDTHALSFAVMDQWLTNIEKDTTSAPARVKVVRDKPPAAEDGCYQSGQPVSQSSCENVQTANELPIQVAGAPLAANVLKCRLKPLDEADFRAHGIELTADQLARLQKTFPQGVCDWSQKGVGQQAPVASWLTFADAAGGRALGTPPVSKPFGPIRVKRCASRRHFQIRLRAPRGDRLRSARVYVNGHRVRLLRGRRLRARVSLRGLPRGRFTVRIVGRTRKGRTVYDVRRYRTCTRKAR